jgi:F-type H+-transporting ATPase subunit b
MNVNITLLGQMITFMLFIWLTFKFIWPPLIKALQARQQKIAEGLAAAERGEHSLELAQHKSSEILQTARGEAEELINQAKQKSVDLIEHARVQARQEQSRLMDQTEAEIDREFKEAKLALREDVIDLVVSAASKVMAKKMNKNTHKKLVNDLIENL